MQHRYDILPVVAFFIALPAATAGSSPAYGDVESGWSQLIRAARTAFDGGEYEEAARLYSSAVHQQAAVGAPGTRLALSLSELGVVRRYQGRCGESSQLLERGIEVLEGTADTNVSLLRGVWEDLGAAYLCQCLYSRAERAYLRAVDLEQSVHPYKKAKMALILSELGAIYTLEAKYAEADAVFKRAQVILDEDSRQNPHELAFLLNNLGILRLHMKRTAEAQAAFQRGLEIVDTAAHTNALLAVDLAQLLNNLGALDYERNQYRDAAAHLARAVDLIDKGLRVQPDDARSVLLNYAHCLRRIGHKKQAKELESRADAMSSVLPIEDRNQFVVDVTQLAQGR